MYYLEGKSKKTTRKSKLIREGGSSFLFTEYPQTSDEWNNSDERTTIDFEVDGISIKFAALSKDKEILNFANTYGLLRIGNHNIKNLNCDYCYMNKFTFSEPFQIEWLEEWRWHINHVKRIYKLYEALKSGKVIEDNYLIVDKWSTRNLHSCTVSPLLGKYKIDDLHVFWANSNSPTMAIYKPSEDTGIEDEYRRNAMRVIDNHLIHFLNESIIVDFHSGRIDHEAAYTHPNYITKEGLPVGMSRTDRKATHYLLGAIYYDIFRKINNLEKIDFCTVCHSPYKSVRKGSMYCSNACKQVKKRNNIVSLELRLNKKSSLGG
jgi:hypothetical protein